MASGDSFLKTLTIEGEYDRLNNFRKFKEPVVYVRLPLQDTPILKAPQTRPGPANKARRGQSLPPAMGRRRLQPTSLVDKGNLCRDYLQPRLEDSALKKRALQFLSSLWLPLCFTGINAVCYAIDPASAALMMASSTFLLHHMGMAGRQLTILVSLVGCAGLLVYGSDAVYIMAVHTLYYLAISMVTFHPHSSLA
ncbi:hypothetical protein PoB_001461400 [Plakobranchus ocellatus]|uniref:Uncharacterized protein n=1 Tax=Plakobranchus ocellatus TaxID=259542 RepID=A0AAV3YYK7_9GAST|nr:hypothetical protein PoB_001461400 [Plakobranchus ocellatus]